MKHFCFIFQGNLHSNVLKHDKQQYSYQQIVYKYKKHTHFNNKPFDQFLHFICWSTCRHLEFLQTLGQSGVPRSLGSKVILHHLNKFPSSLNDSQETLEDPRFAIRTRPIFWNKKPWLSTHILCTVILREIMLWNHGSLFNVMHYTVDNNIINGFRLFFFPYGDLFIME